MIKAGFKRMMILLAVMAAVFAMINGSASADETSSQNSSTVVYSALENAVSKDANRNIITGMHMAKHLMKRRKLCKMQSTMESRFLKTKDRNKMLTLHWNKSILV